MEDSSSICSYGSEMAWRQEVMGVPLSTGEIERMQKLEFERSRRVRLLQVREHERKLALARRNEYQKRMAMKRDMKIQAKYDSFVKTKQERIKATRQECRDALSSIGTAHDYAQIVAQQKSANEAQRQVMQSKSMLREQERLKDAIRYTREERRLQGYEVEKSQQHRRHSAVLKMSSEERSKAQRYRHKLLQNEQAKSQVEIKVPPRDTSAYHLVPNSGPNLRNNGNARVHVHIVQHDPSTSTDAFERADEIERQHTKRAEEEAQRKVKSDEMASKRGNIALHREWMLKERQALLEQLQELENAARVPKKVGATPWEALASHRAALNAANRRQIVEEEEDEDEAFVRTESKDDQPSMRAPTASHDEEPQWDKAQEAAIDEDPATDTPPAWNDESRPRVESQSFHVSSDDTPDSPLDSVAQEEKETNKEIPPKKPHEQERPLKAPVMMDNRNSADLDSATETEEEIPSDVISSINDESNASVQSDNSLSGFNTYARAAMAASAAATAAVRAGRIAAESGVPHFSKKYLQETVERYIHSDDDEDGDLPPAYSPLVKEKPPPSRDTPRRIRELADSVLEELQQVSDYARVFSDKDYMGSSDQDNSVDVVMEPLTPSTYASSLPYDGQSVNDSILDDTEPEPEVNSSFASWMHFVENNLERDTAMLRGTRDIHERINAILGSASESDTQETGELDASELIMRKPIVKPKKTPSPAKKPMSPPKKTRSPVKKPLSPAKAPAASTSSLTSDKDDTDDTSGSELFTQSESFKQIQESLRRARAELEAVTALGYSTNTPPKRESDYVRSSSSYLFNTDAKATGEDAEEIPLHEESSSLNSSWPVDSLSFSHSRATIETPAGKFTNSFKATSTGKTSINASPIWNAKDRKMSPSRGGVEQNEEEETYEISRNLNGSLSQYMVAASPAVSQKSSGLDRDENDEEFDFLQEYLKFRSTPVHDRSLAESDSLDMSDTPARLSTKILPVSHNRMRDDEDIDHSEDTGILTSSVEMESLEEDDGGKYRHATAYELDFDSDDHAVSKPIVHATHEDDATSEDSLSPSHEHRNFGGVSFDVDFTASQTASNVARTRSEKFAARSARRAELAKQKAAEIEKQLIRKAAKASSPRTAQASPPPAPQNIGNPQLIERLSAGTRAAIDPEERRKRTNRMYKALPEVRERELQMEKERQAEERRRKVREMERARRDSLHSRKSFGSGSSF